MAEGGRLGDDGGLSSAGEPRQWESAGGGGYYVRHLLVERHSMVAM